MGSINMIKSDIPCDIALRLIDSARRFTSPYVRTPQMFDRDHVRHLLEHTWMNVRLGRHEAHVGLHAYYAELQSRSATDDRSSTQATAWSAAVR